MTDDDYDLLDRDPRTLADHAYLDAVIGLSPAPVPVMSDEHFDELFTRALRRAEALRSRQRQRSRRRRRRAVFTLLAGGMAVVLAVTGLLVADLRHPRPAYAATPRPLAVMTGGEPVTLAGLADRAPRGDASGTGSVDHLVVDQWDLDSVIDGATVTSAVIPARREIWRTREERARTIVTYLPPQFPTAADRQAWQDDGSPRGSGRRDDYPPGGYPHALPYQVPTGVDRLGAWLAHASSGGDAVLAGARDLIGERALTGAQLSTLLRVLAAETPLAYAGTTVDRAGRPGVAFVAASSDSGAATEEVFVLDPATGRILATETILTTGAPGLRVRRPAVISYRTYLTSERLGTFPG